MAGIQRLPQAYRHTARHARALEGAPCRRSTNSWRRSASAAPGRDPDAHHWRATASGL